MLIKVVALSLPTFAMSVFKLPVTLCTHLECLMANFWWGQKEDERWIYWVSWDKICRSKFQGSLGFRKLSYFNIALLVKQGWRVIQNENSLLHRVLKARYFPHSTFFDATLGKSPFYKWRRIWEAKKYLVQGGRWRIGDGSRVRLWKDPWLPGMFLLTIPSDTLGVDPHTATVNLLIDSSSSYCNLNALHSLFDPCTAAAIQKIPLSQSPYPDKWIWGE